jgi:sarcosine oxidase/L-pipecolate oxidase
MVSRSDRIVIIGAGVFGLSLAYQLASEGNQNVTVMDRHVPPVSINNERSSHQALVQRS